MLVQKEKHEKEAEYEFDPMKSNAFDWDKLSENLQMW